MSHQALMFKDSKWVLWIAALVLLLLSRVPPASQYLSIDNVNLAFALERFSPLEDQPQPPGYPLFVAFARVIDLPFHNAGKSFLLISLLVTALCLPAIAALGERMENSIAGYAAGFLLLLNPAFWQAGLEGPLRPNLALFSLLTAYCCWRAWHGEAQFVLWGALSLGIGSGFRPDLLLYLFPLWIFCALAGTRSARVTAQGLLLLVATVSIWVGTLVYAVGGVRSLYNLLTVYAVDQSRSGSVLLGAATGAWRRQVGRLLVWNGMSAIGWVWVLPFAWVSRTWSIWRTRLFFLFLWVAPGMLFQALVHVAEPGHTLASIPAGCVLGGVAIAAAAERWSSRHAARFAAGAVLAAMVINTLLFLSYFPLPSNAGMLLNAAAYGARESSIVKIQYVDKIHSTTMKELKELIPADRPWIIVSTDDINRRDWFMNWRIVRYYLPDANIWVAADQQHVFQVRRDRIVFQSGSLNIPVPLGGRIIWLLEPGGTMQRDLMEKQRIVTLEKISYTDVPKGSQPFEAWGYTFSPQ